MDTMGNSHLPGNDLDKPIPFDDGLSDPVSSAPPAAGSPGVSRAPLNLGGLAEPASTPAKTPTARIVTSSPITKKSSNEHLVSTDRISGLKTFFTKLHPGAMEFLDGLVNTWLQENPGVVVKRTDVATGDVQAKKTEPNIIVCIWY
jgi:hypothetical protein